MGMLIHLVADVTAHRTIVKTGHLSSFKASHFPNTATFNRFKNKIKELNTTISYKPGSNIQYTHIKPSNTNKLLPANARIKKGVNIEDDATFIPKRVATAKENV